MLEQDDPSSNPDPDDTTLNDVDSLVPLNIWRTTPSILETTPILEAFNLVFHPTHNVIIILTTGKVLSTAPTTIHKQIVKPTLLPLKDLLSHLSDHYSSRKEVIDPDPFLQAGNLQPPVEGLALYPGTQCGNCHRARDAHLPPQPRHIRCPKLYPDRDPTPTPCVFQRFGPKCKDQVAVDLPPVSVQAVDDSTILLNQLTTAQVESQHRVQGGAATDIIPAEYVRHPALLSYNFYDLVDKYPQEDLQSLVFPTPSTSSNYEISFFGTVRYLAQHYLKEWADKAGRGTFTERRQLMDLGPTAP